MMQRDLSSFRDENGKDIHERIPQHEHDVSTNPDSRFVLQGGARISSLDINSGLDQIIRRPPVFQTTTTSSSNVVPSLKTPSKTDTKPKGSYVMPCKARKMAPDHNFMTAFFVIDDDTVHGQDLICSHPKCREGGVKFCFCEWCGLPVTKSNFKGRHDHSMDEQVAFHLKSAHQDVDGVPDMRITSSAGGTSFFALDGAGAVGLKEHTASSTQDKLDLPSDIAISRNQHGTNGDESHPRGVSAQNEGERPPKKRHAHAESSSRAIEQDRKKLKARKKKLKKSRQQDEDPRSRHHDLLSPKHGDGRDQKKSSSVTKEDSVVSESERVKLWQALLKARPQLDDAEEMAKWMNQVVVVSKKNASVEEIRSAVPVGLVLSRKQKDGSRKERVARLPEGRIEDESANLSSSTDITTSDED